MDLQMRNTLKEATWKRYRKAKKPMKTKILDELCAVTGYHRQYAIAQLNQMGDREPRLPRTPRTRPRHYTRDVLAVIEKVWEEAGYPWSVRLKGILKLWMPWIRRRYALTPLQETKILEIGARTIDRYLASKKRDLRKRLYGHTKPGTLLRHQIPIKCESWNEITAGPLELDTVSHSGEFINHHLYNYCQQERIGFTRSRPYKKDDNAHIEQKNWTPVRKIIGWDRYETPEAVQAMNDLYTQELRLYMNLFQPSVKLQERVRKGSRKTRRYDPPLTALDRLLQLPKADLRKLEPLAQLRARLDSFALATTIRRKLDRLWNLRTRRKSPGRAADPAEAAAEAKEIAQSLARRMDIKR